MSFAFNRGVGSNFSTKIWKEIFHGNSCWQEVLKVLQDWSQQSQRSPYAYIGIDPHGEIVDEIIDNDLEENIWNKFINIFKGPVDLKEKGKKK